MRRLLILALLAAPAAAPAQTTEDGMSLVERGMGIIADNLWQKLGPDLDRLGQDMDGTLSRLAPMLEDLTVLVDDLRNYEAPERLENGDVLIRRKPGSPPPPPIGETPRDPSPPRIPVDPDQPEIPL